MRRPASSGPIIAVIIKSRKPSVLRDVQPYVRWVIRNGGVPSEVFIRRRVPTSAQGILLLGGEDIAPARYGDTDRHCERINEARDAYELDLLGDVLARDVPVLAVCRGIQVLAVAMGGTLYQDLPRELRRDGVRSRVVHRGPQQTDSTHRITVEPDSLLSRVIGPGTVVVNSHHHQAIRDVPRAARVTARARDGTIEAIEHRTNRFVLGVQWHPERWRHASSDAIMRGFVGVCAGR